MEVSVFALRTPSPLDVLDGAFAAVRHGGLGLVARAWFAGAPIALVALAIYYLERVEGVHGMRPLFALAVALAWWQRALGLGVAARAYALVLRPNLPMPAGPRRPVDVVCTASVVGLGLWAWSWPLFGAVIASPLFAAAVLPFLAARGAVAPSWLARAACARGGGWAAFAEAADDTRGMRGVFLVAEMMVLFGAIGLFVNLYAAIGGALLLAHGVFGLDVAFVSSFVSPENDLMLLLVAVATLVALEPLRAAVSAQAFVEARSRRDGADLHAAIDAAIASSTRRRRGLESHPPTAAAVLIACALGMPAVTRAEPPAPTAGARAVPADTQPDPRDAEVREQTASILRRDEFREFAGHDDRSVRDWLHRLWAFLASLFERDEDKPPPRMPLELPLPPAWLLMGMALVGLALVVFYASRGRGAATPSPGGARASDADTDRPPERWLDDAARLAATGDLRGALRSLYLATLVALDRAGLIRRDASSTNGQYLRAMPRGEARKLFAAFTRVFDRTWYGRETPSLADYEGCRRIAERLRAAPEAAP